jgi:8-oxo-dGTP pyrophosphatase MutT (NUDIX family)
MVQRAFSAQFLGGAWVFPGGAVDEDDGSLLLGPGIVAGDPDLARWRAAALRELVEETGFWLVAFPTRKIVEFLGEFASSDRLRRGIEDQPSVEPIQPRLSVANTRIEILMPDEPGFEEAAVGERDPELMEKMTQIVAAGGDAPPEFRPT